MTRWVVLMVGLFVVSASVSAAAPERAYGDMVRLIRTVYLHREAVEASELLGAAAERLEREVPWLIANREGNTVYISRGVDQPVGSVSVGGVESLDHALLALERLVVMSGYDADAEDIRLGVLRGVADGLDRHSVVLDGERLDRFQERLRGETVGIGVRLRAVDGGLRITSVLPESPAANSGLRAGDILTRIEPYSMVNMSLSEAKHVLAGPIGSTLEVEYRRGDVLTQLELTRSQLTIPNVEHRVIGDGVGYIKISHFSRQSDENLRQALRVLRESGALERGLVLDLRGNSGGSMKDSARCVDEFITEGTILETAGPDGNPVPRLQSRMDAGDSGTEPSVPMAILVDGRSASGAEIVAGALQRLRGAVLIGANTYGKGTVQKVFYLAENVRFKLTVARYSVAGGVTLPEEGFAPDAVVGRLRDVDGGLHLSASDGALEEQVISLDDDGDAGDAVLEWARLAVSEAAGSDRAAVLSALLATKERVAAWSDQAVSQRLQRQGLDWERLGPISQQAGTLEVDLQPDFSLDEQTGMASLRLSLVNGGTMVLERVWVSLESDEASPWHGAMLPVGRISPGETASVVHSVRLGPNTMARLEQLNPIIHAAGFAPQRREPIAFTVQSPAPPQLSASARWVEDAGLPAVELKMYNLGDHQIEELEFRLHASLDAQVEVVTPSVAIPGIPAGASRMVRLGVKPGLGVDDVAVTLEARTDGEGHPLWSIPLVLPRSGEAIAVKPPALFLDDCPFTTEESSVMCRISVAASERLSDVVAFANGEKVAWYAGENAGELGRVTFPLEDGKNVIYIRASAASGLTVTARQRVLREQEPTADAGSP